jgi:hypothetical protein
MVRYHVNYYEVGFLKLMRYYYFNVPDESFETSKAANRGTTKVNLIAGIPNVEAPVYYRNKDNVQVN